MKVKKLCKFGVFVVLMLLFSLHAASSYGASEMLPPSQQLLRNQQGRFFFYVSAIGSPTSLSCSYSVSGMDPLIITFDEETVIVPAGEEAIVYGNIIVPADAPLEGYSGTVLVTCEPSIEMDVTGSKLVRLFTVPFSLSIVQKLAERPPPHIPEKAKPPASPLPILMVIVLVVAIVGIGYWYRKRERVREF